MKPLTDEAAFDFADRMDKWREIDRKWRAGRRAVRRRFYLRTLGALAGVFILIWIFSGCAKRLPPKPFVSAYHADPDYEPDKPLWKIRRDADKNINRMDNE